jgi:hypothetical protein
MTVPSLTAVTTRVGEIRGQINRIASNGKSFAQVLEATSASSRGATDGTSFVVTPQASTATHTRFDPTSVPIGIMGTPIVLRPGATISPYLPGPSGPWADALPAAGQSWAPAIEKAANEAGIEPRLLAAMVWQESGFKPEAVSKSGAIGLAQLMPATAEGLGVDPHDPVENLDGGARYLAWTIREFGSLELGLAAYNAGPGNVRAANGIPDIPETQDYVPRVLDYYRRLGGVA